MLLLADKWKDYELIDMGNGEKLERWGDIVLRRPDPQVMWPIPNESGLWKNPHGHYHRSNRGGGQWEHKKKYPERWRISYKNLVRCKELAGDETADKNDWTGLGRYTFE